MAADNFKKGAYLSLFESIERRIKNKNFLLQAEGLFSAVVDLVEKNDYSKESYIKTVYFEMLEKTFGKEYFSEFKEFLAEYMSENYEIDIEKIYKVVFRKEEKTEEVLKYRFRRTEKILWKQIDEMFLKGKYNYAVICGVLRNLIEDYGAAEARKRMDTIITDRLMFKLSATERVKRMKQKVRDRFAKFFLKVRKAYGEENAGEKLQETVRVKEECCA